MTPEPTDSLLRLSTEGTRARHAVAALERFGTPLCTAVRRGLSFLARRTTPIEVVFVRAAPVTELLALLEGPVHRADLVAQPNSVASALIFDRGAISLTLDGVLGGDGTSPPDLDSGPALSGPQNAVINRLSIGLVSLMSEFMSTRGGPKVTQKTASVTVNDEAAPIAILIRFGPDNCPGHLLFWIGKDALTPTEPAKSAPLALPEATAPQAIENMLDPRVADRVGRAEIELIAELARVKMPLADLSLLQVGDMLRLNVPVDSDVRVHCAGRTVFVGRPTSVAGQIGVRILQRQDGDGT
jgi:flagellar motor switch protein FliM